MTWFGLYGMKQKWIMKWDSFSKQTIGTNSVNVLRGLVKWTSHSSNFHLENFISFMKSIRIDCCKMPTKACPLITYTSFKIDILAQFAGLKFFQLSG